MCVHIVWYSYAMLNVVEPILSFPLCKYICLGTIFYVLSPLSQLLGLLKIKRLWKWGAVVCLWFWRRVQSVYETSLYIQLQSLIHQPAPSVHPYSTMQRVSISRHTALINATMIISKIIIIIQLPMCAIIPRLLRKKECSLCICAPCQSKWLHCCLRFG